MNIIQFSAKFVTAKLIETHFEDGICVYPSVITLLQEPTLCIFPLSLLYLYKKHVKSCSCLMSFNFLSIL